MSAIHTRAAPPGRPAGPRSLRNRNPDSRRRNDRLAGAVVIGPRRSMLATRQRAGRRRRPVSCAGCSTPWSTPSTGRTCVGPPVQAVALRRGPEPDLLEVRLVVRMERVAVPGVRGLVARLGVGRSLAEPLGDLRLDLGRGDVVHPQVRAVGVRRLGVDHPGVGPAGRALLGQRRVDRGLVGLGEVDDGSNTSSQAMLGKNKANDLPPCRPCRTPRSPRPASAP